MPSGAAGHAQLMFLRKRAAGSFVHPKQRVMAGGRLVRQGGAYASGFALVEVREGSFGYRVGPGA